MRAGIVGLGLIGGSFAKAYSEAGHEVLAFDRDESVLSFAQIEGAVSAPLTKENIGTCDIVLVAIYPEAAIAYVTQMAPYIGKKPMVIDCCGTKRVVCRALFPLAQEHGFTYLGGHPMAGTHNSGFKYARANLCRSGRLLEGESGHLLPLDALFGLIVFPFKHLFLRIRTVSFALTHRKTGEDKHPAAWAAMAVGALLALGLLALAVRELSGADAAFDAWTQKLLGVFQWRLNEQTLWNVLLSLPVGAYLFGLIAGTGREKIEAVRARGERVNAALGSLRKVPVAVWTAALGVFAALYLAFFSLQAGYLFGAFVKMIPDGYTIAEYARQGFFSLCRVMAVNFALLWLVTRACVKPVRQEKTLLLLCAVLLCQSLVFAAIAASKLYLYISSYGFTLRRLQSAWLIAVLAAGTGCALYSLVTGKKAVRYWMLFSAATLMLLSLY